MKLDTALRSILPSLACALLLLSGCSKPTTADSDKKKTGPVDAPAPAETEAAAGTGGEENVALELPTPVFIGTPMEQPEGVRMDPNPRQGPRKPYRAPKDVKLISLDKPVTASDKTSLIGEIKQITDGDKEGASGSYVEFAPGTQWAQVDLGKKYEIYPILIWFYHGDPRVYHDVIVQVSDDPDFIENVATLFNNDFDNSTGLGVGTDYEFYETNEGKLVDGRRGGKPTVARYIRVYSNGCTAEEMNRFTEIEVWGRPAK